MPCFKITFLSWETSPHSIPFRKDLNLDISGGDLGTQKAELIILHVGPREFLPNFSRLSPTKQLAKSNFQEYLSGQALWWLCAACSFRLLLEADHRKDSSTMQLCSSVEERNTFCFSVSITGICWFAMPSQSRSVDWRQKMAAGIRASGDDHLFTVRQFHDTED